MNPPASAPLEQVIDAAWQAYLALIWSVPLVFAGILLTGSAYYLAFLRPRMGGRGWKHWLSYLFPREMYSSPSARIDIKVWLLNGLVFIPIFEACVIMAGLVAGVGFVDLYKGWFGPAPSGLHQAWSIAAFQFLGYWLGQGIGQYSGHLAMHKVPALWALHRAHHSAESANLFTFLRSHPLEHFLNGTTRVLGMAAGLGLAVYLTGAHFLPETAAAIFWYNVAYVLIGFRSVDHLHIPVSYGRVLDVLIGSPIMHQVHHSAEPQHRDVNMAGAGYLFDWLFGTLYIPEKGETWRWGLNHEEIGKANPHNTLKGFFVEPIGTMGKHFGMLTRSRKETES
jgi:sterol desaturase/sphingolipid hydroxylase (fatty acid hydroxylase superfamily)